MNKEAERLVEVEKKLQKQLEGQLSVMRFKPFFLKLLNMVLQKEQLKPINPKTWY